MRNGILKDAALIIPKQKAMHKPTNGYLIYSYLNTGYFCSIKLSTASLTNSEIFLPVFSTNSLNFLSCSFLIVLGRTFRPTGENFLNGS
jgi:hypothetical protein